MRYALLFCGIALGAAALLGAGQPQAPPAMDSSPSPAPSPSAQSQQPAETDAAPANTPEPDASPDLSQAQAQPQSSKEAAGPEEADAPARPPAEPTPAPAPAPRAAVLEAGQANGAVWTARQEASRIRVWVDISQAEAVRKALRDSPRAQLRVAVYCVNGLLRMYGRRDQATGPRDDYRWTRGVRRSFTLQRFSYLPLADRFVPPVLERHELYCSLIQGEWREPAANARTRAQVLTGARVSVRPYRPIEPQRG